MRITTFLRSTFFIFFIGISHTLSAQSSIGLFSNHTLNSRVPLVNGSSSDVLHIQGAGIEYRRDWETRHLFAFTAGFNTLASRSTAFVGDSFKEIYLQARWKLFNPIINKSKLKGFFSVGPGLFYFNDSFANSLVSTDFDFQEWISGVDFQIGFNVDYELCEQIKLIGYVNPVSFVTTLSITEIDNPMLTRDQNRVTDYNFDVNIFSELRVGVMYNLRIE